MLVQDYIYKLDCKKFPKWRQPLYTGIRRKTNLKNLNRITYLYGLGQLELELKFCLLAIYLYAQEDFG